MTERDIRPMPTLKLPEIERELDKLSEAQLDALDYLPEWLAMRSSLAARYQEAIRRGWLLGPA